MKIRYNAPVTLTFSFIAVIVLILENIFSSFSYVNFINYLFSVPGREQFSFFNPIDYFRLVSHILGHADWAHLIGNLSFILLLGPTLEEKVGSAKLLLMILMTAFFTGLLNVLFFKTGLMGASGIVFMLILLSSITNCKEGEIPLTFILIAVLYLGTEFIKIFTTNNISEFAHIAGGTCGSLFGFAKKFDSSSSDKKESHKKNRSIKKSDSEGQYITLDDINNK